MAQLSLFVIFQIAYSIFFPETQKHILWPDCDAVLLENSYYEIIISQQNLRHLAALCIERHLRGKISITTFILVELLF